MAISDGAMRVLAALFEARTGQQIAPARRWRVETVLNPLLARYGLPNLDAMVGRIVSGSAPCLTEAAIDALLNHETFFFRDIKAFRQLDEKGLARLQAARQASRSLRIWSAGCSTGQEAYTLAMLIQEQPARWQGWSVQIIATDLSPAAIERAQRGRYSTFEAQRGLPIGHLVDRFRKQGDDWEADARLRAGVRFRVHNLLELPPPGMFDLVLCRNVLLYFSAEVRARVFARLASAMAPDGLLMLGAGETVMGQTDAFVPDDDCRGFFRRPAPPLPMPVAARFEA